MRTYSGSLFELPENGIFVFGSNTQGRYGKGAALIAKENFGAIYGMARGLQGRSYAICTKDLTSSELPSVTSIQIKMQIATLYSKARFLIEKDFYVAYSGAGTNLNGYTPLEMAKMFAFRGKEEIPENIIFEETFEKLIQECLSEEFVICIIAGGRDFDDYSYLEECCYSALSPFLNREEKIKIRSGCAKGADKLGEKFAKESNFPLELYPANWDQFGKRAGYLRNESMALGRGLNDRANILIAFWDGVSKGTKHMIDIAKRENIETHIFNY